MRHFVCVGLLSITLTSGIYAQYESKLAPELRELDPAASVDVIIRYNQTPTAFTHTRVASKGGRHHQTFEYINSAHYTVPAASLAELANDPDVVFINPDRKVSATAAAVNPDYGWMGVLQVTNPSDRGPYDGSDIGVAVIDSGIASDRDLSQDGDSRIVYSQSFVPGDPSTNDAYGHGTHVAGIVGGNGSKSQGAFYRVRGVASNVDLINLRVLDAYGASTDAVVIQAINKAIALKNQYNIRVINLSLGRPATASYINDPLCQAVEAAWRQGIVVVVAAGNDGRQAPTQGYGTIMVPGNDPYVITVGAMNTNGTLDRSDDKMTSYSSKGPTLFDHIVKPDLVAPGNQIFSVLAPNSTLVNLDAAGVVTVGNKYFVLSGTSMATPMVSAAAALLLDQNPHLSPDQVKAKLMRSADKVFPAATCPTGATCPTQAYKATTASDALLGGLYTTYYDIFTVGAGYLNVDNALEDTTPVPWGGSSLSPSVTRDSTNVVSLMTGSSVIWGSGSSWETSVIWGSSTLSGNSVIWGSSVIWGQSADAVQSVIWGSSIIWGSGTPAADVLSVSLYGDK